jgi:hypothetical protein
VPGVEIIAIVVLAGIIWLWFDSLRAREAAVSAARSACAVEGLMLLDDTVAICGLKLARNGEGRLTLQRAYDFEYSDTGNNRLGGSIVLLGREVIMLNVGPGERAGSRLED